MVDIDTRTVQDILVIGITKDKNMEWDIYYCPMEHDTMVHLSMVCALDLELCALLTVPSNIFIQ